MQAAQKVIFNTLITYGRSFLTVFITLYSTRLIISALGVSDYGLYSLVGGVVGMLAFFKSALTSSTQRYISFNLGKGLIDQVKKIVANSFVIHLTTGLLIVILVELIGSYFITHKLVIPDGRMETALIVFHFVVASTFITILSVPIDAILNAHENMLSLAVLGIIEALLKLGVALTLGFISSYDKLIIYSALLFGVLFCINFIKWVYCRKKYKETKVSLVKDVDLNQIKEQTSFAGWNLFGAACAMGRGHGVAIISNMFFGTTVNAAFGIANQVKAQSSFFSDTILKAINPQIMKSEGADNRKRMLRLSMMGSKFGFFFLAFFAIPLIFEMPYIIQAWLGRTPEYAVVFCVLILIGAMVEQLTVGLKSAVQSVGDIKHYMVVVGGIILLNIPISYLLLRLGAAAETVLIVFIALELLAGIVRLFYSRKITGLSIIDYLNKVLIKLIMPVVTSILTCLVIMRMFGFEHRFFLTMLVSASVFFTSVYFFGLCEDEKEILGGLYRKILKKIKN